MKNKLLLASTLMLLSAEPAWALYCGTQLVLEGQYQLEVLQRCGPPNWQNQRLEYRSVMTGNRFLTMNPPLLHLQQAVPVYIDEWIYNFGPNSLMQVLVFVNGRLEQTKYLGYGD